MNPTSRAIFQTVMSSDATLTSSERAALERLLRGESAIPAATTGGADEQLLLSQKKAAKLLDVPIKAHPLRASPEFNDLD